MKIAVLFIISDAGRWLGLGIVSTDIWYNGLIRLFVFEACDVTLLGKAFENQKLTSRLS